MKETFTIQEVVARTGLSVHALRNCVVTLRVMPVVDGNRTFVEWSATFDCESTEEKHWTRYFAHEVWAKALASLKQQFSHT